MARKHGPGMIESSERKYDSELIRLYEDRVIKPDGSRGTYATVRMQDGVAVLAVGDEGEAYFIREFRYALGRENVEVAAGAIDEGESPEEAARRELREELGVEAREFVRLGSVEYATSMLRSSSTLFLARSLSFTEKDEDPSEEIETVKMPFDEAVSRALSGDFLHATTALLVLRARHYLKRELKP